MADPTLSAQLQPPKHHFKEPTTVANNKRVDCAMFGTSEPGSIRPSWVEDRTILDSFQFHGWLGTKDGIEYPKSAGVGYLPSFVPLPRDRMLQSVTFSMRFNYKINNSLATKCKITMEIEYSVPFPGTVVLDVE
ncbi:hypothetical protein RHGRI_031591 [Rhododendron griersonianum]|uniref:Arrestin-like N-terminal domain-containing protein n=1 Tax=Rhododendron griersonianum TaxID=479676 RepID=A0AAV6IBJ2_9ERIC|nr:hypothetical protein RHGRI_031591 [Rhododendron griersonianum]